MKTFKKYISYLAIIFVLILAACGGEQTSSNDSSNGKDGDKVEFAQGVTDDEILIGLSAPQTGPLAVYDTFRKGMEAYFQYVNDNGGVHGRNLKLIAYDDQYQPAQAMQTAKRLIEDDKVFLVAGNMGSAALQATKDMYIKSGMPVVMPGSGITEFVDPPVKNWFGSSMLNYEVEAKILLHYAIEELGAKRIGIAYQNDDFGKTPLNAIKEAIENYPDAEIVAEVSYLPSDTDFSSQAQKLQDANPDTVFNLGVMSPAVNLKKAIYKIGMEDVNYFVTSVAGGDTNAFELAGKEIWEGTYSDGTMHPIDDLSNEKVKLFHDEFSKRNPNEPITGFTMSGWAVAQVVVEGLERTEGELTWEKYYEALETLDNWEGSIYNGITFSKDNHYGLNKVYITQARDGKIEPISDFISFDPTTGEITYSE